MVAIEEIDQLAVSDGVSKQIIREGAGKSKPRLGSKVCVHYVGRLPSTGKQFDSSRDRYSPLEFEVGKGVIKGWSEGIATMRKGELARFTIQPAKAYGAKGKGDTIPPNSGV